MIVGDVNEAPIMTPNSLVYLDENVSNALTLNASDLDAGTILTYSISGADSDKFTVNAKTGAITFKIAPDYEHPSDTNDYGLNTYLFTATASDGELASSQSVTVSILNVNDPPRYVGSLTATANENQNYAIELLVEDDENSLLNFDTVNPTPGSPGTVDSARFTVDGQGVLRFIYPPDYEFPQDANGDNAYLVTVNISGTVVGLTITVANVNEAPIAQTSPIAVQGQTHSFNASDFNATDPENDPYESITITGLSLADGDQLTYDGSSLTLPKTINRADLSKLVYRPAVGASGNARSKFTFLANDQAIGTQSADAILNVAASGPVPTADPQTVQAVEDEFKLITLTADDGDPSAVNALTYFITSQPATGSLYTSPTGSDIRSFPYELTGNQVYFRSATNDHSSQAFKFKVVGPNSTESNEALVSVNVSSVNDAPQVELSQNSLSLPENTLTPYAVADISIVDDDEGNENLSLSGDDAELFEISNNKLRLKNGVVLDYEDKHEFNVTVNVDDATVGLGIDSFIDFRLSLTDVNEAPTVVATPANRDQAEGAAPATINLTTVFQDVDAADGSLTYEASSSNPSLVATQINNGVLTLSFAPRLNGSAAITLRTKDSGNLEATTSFTVTVQNSLPTVTLSKPSQSVVGQLRSFLITPGDHTDNGTAPFGIAVEWGDGSSNSYSSTSAVTAEHAWTTPGMKSIKITVTDPQGGVAVLWDSVEIVESAVQGTTFLISGTPASDTLVINANSNGSLSVSLNSAPPILVTRPIERVELYLGAGSDTVSFNGTAADDLFQVTGSTAYWAFAATPAAGMTIAAVDTEVFNINALGGDDQIELLAEAANGTSFVVAGGNGNDDISAANSVSNNKWQITGMGIGSVAFGSAAVPSLSFIEIENLTGSSVVPDLFQVSSYGGLSGSINGGDGSSSDSLTLEKSATAFMLENFSTPGIGAITGIESINANDGILYGAGVQSVWTVDGPGAGFVDFDGKQIRFQGMGRLIGSSKKDEFNFLPAGYITEISDPSYGSDGDVISYSQYASPIQVGLTSVGSNRGSGTGISRFWNIERIVGSNFDDAFTSPNVGTGSVNWTIDSANGGTVGSPGATVQFESFENLLGGTRSDLFLLGSSGSARTISGGTGAQPDTIQGPDISNKWSIRASGVGYINGLGFTGIENVTGGSDADYIDMDRAGIVPGRLDPGAGINSLSYELRPTAISVNLATATPTATGIGTIVDKFAIIVGGAGGDTLTGGNNGSLIFGGGGNDQITGGTGKDVLIGGVGADTLRGGSGEDIVIGGRVSFESIDAGRKALFSAWSASSSNYQDRISSLLRSETTPQPYYLSNHATPHWTHWSMMPQSTACGAKAIRTG